MATSRSAAAQLRATIATVPGTYGVAGYLALGKRRADIKLTPAGDARGADAGAARAAAATLPREGLQSVDRPNDSHETCRRII